MARTAVPDGFDAIHNIYGKALRAAEPSRWPSRPHRGGPCPVMSSRTQLAIGVAIADEARRRVPPLDPVAFDTLHDLAKRVSDGEQIASKRLDDVSKPSKKDDPTIRIAKLAIRAAANFLYSPPSARNAAGIAVTNAAAVLVPVLAQRGGEAVTSYLAWLDDEIMRHDLAARLAERSLVPTSPIAAVLSRPMNEKRVLALSVARLASGAFGLYVKLKTKWEWHEGDRATIFATVPDAYMDAVSRDLETH